MAQSITPFLWFDNQAEEAMNYYLSVFADSELLSVARYGEAGPGEPGSVMTAEFLLNDQTFVALNGGPVYTFSPAISFVINCDSQDEIDHYWGKLSEGGDPNSQQCGWLKDKYGLSWQVVPSALGQLMSNPATAGNVMSALLKMKKLDIKKLEEAGVAS